MPPDADDPPSDPVSADLPVASSADAAAGMPPSVPSEPEGRSDGSPGDQPHRRRRRRRRRLLPRDADPAADRDAVVISADEAPSRANVSDAEAGVGDGAAEPHPAPGTAHTTGDHPQRRRRRRRRPPPGALGSALPAVDSGAVAQIAADDGSPPESTANGEARPADAQADAARGATGYLRLPVRRRRRLPRPPGLQRGTADAASPNGGIPAGDAPTSAPRAEGEFPRRQRRRRPPPRIGEAVPAGQDQSAEGARRDPDRPPRGRGPNRRPGEERPRDAQPQQPGEQQRRGPDRGPRDGDNSSPRGRERGDRDDRGARGRGPGGARDGQRGRGRDAPARRVEQKLYTLESMVDRGFEDVADEAEDGGSRRVHWTIVKRSVADQKSGKATSSVYVLQRDGAETEFPNLGAARATANKTIIHPEKLTMSKAEHVAAKNSK